MYGPGGRRGRSGPWPQVSHVSGHELQLAVMSQRWWLLMLSLLFISFCDWLRFRQRDSVTPSTYIGYAWIARMCSYTQSCAWSTVSVCTNELWQYFILLYLFESKPRTVVTYMLQLLHTKIVWLLHSCMCNKNSFRVKISPKRYSIWTSFPISRQSLWTLQSSLDV